MLSKAREKLVRSLKTRKGREKAGLCLVEGRKAVEAAGDAVEFAFTREDTPDFDRLVDAETPQDVAAVARLPRWTDEELLASRTVVVLDGVQDPGNVGGIFRLCLGFGASMLLVESADPTAPKTVRSSAGALFAVPWKRVGRGDAVSAIAALERPVFRLEKRAGAKDISVFADAAEAVLILGSEGSGISIDAGGAAVAIPHRAELESLNVGHAAAIALYERMKKTP